MRGPHIQQRSPRRRTWVATVPSGRTSKFTTTEPLPRLRTRRAGNSGSTLDTSSSFKDRGAATVTGARAAGAATAASAGRLDAVAAESGAALALGLDDGMTLDSAAPDGVSAAGTAGGVVVVTRVSAARTGAAVAAAGVAAFVVGDTGARGAAAAGAASSRGARLGLSACCRIMRKTLSASCWARSVGSALEAAGAGCA